MPAAESGMAAEQAQFDSAANNIANANTPGYSSESVTSEPLPGGGVETTGSGVLPGIPPADPQNTDVDLGQQMAGMMLASTMYGADARTITVQSQVDRTLLNIIA
jgi:flagellar hook protein FlgE